MEIIEMNFHKSKWVLVLLILVAVLGVVSSLPTLAAATPAEEPAACCHEGGCDCATDCCCVVNGCECCTGGECVCPECCCAACDFECCATGACPCCAAK